MKKQRRELKSLDNQQLAQVLGGSGPSLLPLDRDVPPGPSVVDTQASGKRQHKP